MNSPEEIQDLREYFELSILVCEEKMMIEGENGDKFWSDMKELWIEKLKELNDGDKS